MQIKFYYLTGGFWQLLLKNSYTKLSPDDAYKDPQDSKWTFASHYHKHVLPHVKTFEEKRIHTLKKYRSRLRVVASILAIISTVLFMHIMDNGFDGGHFFVIFVSLMVATWWAYAPVRAYKKQIKSIVFPDIFKYFGKSFKYQINCPFSVEEYTPFGIIPHHTGEQNEDYIQGTYKGVGIKLFESRLTKTTGSGKNRRTVVVFRGMFLELTMNKDFKGKTLVQRNVGKLLGWVADKFDGAEMQAVHLEDPEFEKQFTVRSTNQVEARYLLTTSFMERLKQLSDLIGSERIELDGKSIEFGGGRIECSFYQKKVLFKVHSHKNRFETSSVYVPATFEKDIHDIMTEMHIIFEMIEHLKLHEKTRL